MQAIHRLKFFVLSSSDGEEVPTHPFELEGASPVWLYARLYRTRPNYSPTVLVTFHLVMLFCDTARPR